MSWREPIAILKGESPAVIRIPPRLQGVAAFDGRQLRRWNISEARLPAGSDVRFRGPSLWSDYKREVLGGPSALILQSLLIVGLLHQRRARQRAELASRRNLALAADANRRVTMSALTGSIAHELSQPVGLDSPCPNCIVPLRRASYSAVSKCVSVCPAHNAVITPCLG